MKFNLVALATLAAVASAVPDARKEHQLEIRDDVVKVDKVTFYGWDGKPQDTSDATIFYNDPDVLAESEGDNEKRFFGFFWRKWWWWKGQRCNWCNSCSHHYYGGCHTGRCCI